MAHLMGIAVVAEGVETAGEFRAVLQAGCNYVQGFFVAQPSRSTEALKDCYSGVDVHTDLARHERRGCRAAR